MVNNRQSWNIPLLSMFFWCEWKVNKCLKKATCSDVRLVCIYCSYSSFMIVLTTQNSKNKKASNSSGEEKCR